MILIVLELQIAQHLDNIRQTFTYHGGYTIGTDYTKRGMLTNNSSRQPQGMLLNPPHTLQQIGQIKIVQNILTFVHKHKNYTHIEEVGHYIDGGCICNIYRSCTLALGSHIILETLIHCQHSH